MNNLPKIKGWTIIKNYADDRCLVYLTGIVNGKPIVEELLRIDFTEHTASTKTETYELID